jgi:hypothetical protein
VQEQKLVHTQPWPERHTRLTAVILLVTSTILTIFVLEIALRIAGKTSGYIPRYRTFEPVDSLIVEYSFITDAEGVFKANPEFDWPEGITINSQGFRGAEWFTDDDTRKHDILFLGDSFTWGSSARPITESFVDIVERNGYRTYNCGIPGTDPGQYAYLAEKWIPLLKPRYVAVMFYMGNDFALPRPMLPHKNLFHMTNAGMLQAFDPDGTYMTAEQAYQTYVDRSNAASVMQKPKTIKERIHRAFLKTVVGTYLWTGLSQLKRKVKSVQAGAAAEEYTFTHEFLDRIRRAAAEHSAQFLLFIIPVRPARENIYTSIKSKMPVLAPFTPLIPTGFDESFYMKKPNDHFNNAGHEKYADFILKTLSKD